MAAKILVVDDSMMVRRQVSQALVQAGFSVIEASDGADALAKIGDGVALVVCDVNMPNMSGLDFLTALRESPTLAATNVVMLTTEGQNDLIQKAKALGAKGWMVKPFKPELLVGAVKKIAGA
jgi:two-component system chemotaxis response regulator CheY